MMACRVARLAAGWQDIANATLFKYLDDGRYQTDPNASAIVGLGKLALDGFCVGNFPAKVRWAAYLVWAGTEAYRLQRVYEQTGRLTRAEVALSIFSAALLAAVTRGAGASRALDAAADLKGAPGKLQPRGGLRPAQGVKPPKGRPTSGPDWQIAG